MTTGKQQNLQSRWQQIEKNGKVQNIIQTVLYTRISRTILVKKIFLQNWHVFWDRSYIHIQSRAFNDFYCEQLNIPNAFLKVKKRIELYK